MDGRVLSGTKVGSIKSVLDETNDWAVSRQTAYDLIATIRERDKTIAELREALEYECNKCDGCHGTGVIHHPLPYGDNPCPECANARQAIAVGTKPDNQHYKIIGAHTKEQIGCCWGESGKAEVLAEEPCETTFVACEPSECPVCQQEALATEGEMEK